MDFADHGRASVPMTPKQTKARIRGN
jgi:hypothetical protein